ncbi:MAG: preprotein translocase subunit SecY [Planctomycetes bacterium]|nr:preprotein translocase subunit SecY [Planctomycetota bacterium]
MLASVANITKIPELRRKLLITFLLLIVYRVGFFITLPYVDQNVLDRLVEQQSQGGLGRLMNFASTITGGDLIRCTIFALGIMPYISASIIFQLLIKVIPALEALSKEGESGRKKISQYTRYATVGLCALQSLFIVSWMVSRQVSVGGDTGLYIVPESLQGPVFYVTTIVTLTTGTMFLMWLGEQISEFGIGNGISLIIMAGIIARLPAVLTDQLQQVLVAAQDGRNPAFDVLKLVVMAVLFMLVTVGVVLMTQGQRRIAIQQAKHTRGRRVFGGAKHYMPLRVNSAGVMPIIFAQTLLVFPAVLLSYFARDLGSGLINSRGFVYYTLYVGLIGFFTYFWVSLTFNPVEMANNMREYGSMIKGIRPGRRTAEYLERIMNRITLVGSVFLVAIALVPMMLSQGMEVDPNLTDFLGGTAILIVVGVALDIVQKVESHLIMRDYDGLIKGGRIRGRRG